jgi:hypothetical protein
LALAFPLPGRPSPPEEESALVGGSILLLCYLAASNWDYRLVFALLMIPYFLRPAARGERAIGWITVAAMVFACNFAPLALGFGDLGILVNTCAKYLLYCIVVFTLARIMLMDTFAQRLLARLRGAPTPAMETDR